MSCETRPSRLYLKHVPSTRFANAVRRGVLRLISHRHHRGIQLTRRWLSVLRIAIVGSVTIVLWQNNILAAATARVANAVSSIVVRHENATDYYAVLAVYANKSY